MVSQLRIYQIEQGKLDDFVEAWTAGVAPLRRAQGFRIDGAWVAREDSVFAWILSYDGPEDWESKNEAYYGSPEREALDPDPAAWIAEASHWLIEALPVG